MSKILVVWNFVSLISLPKQRIMYHGANHMDKIPINCQKDSKNTFFGMRNNILSCDLVYQDFRQESSTQRR